MLCTRKEGTARDVCGEHERTSAGGSRCGRPAQSLSFIRVGDVPVRALLRHGARARDAQRDERRQRSERAASTTVERVNAMCGIAPPSTRDRETRTTTDETSRWRCPGVHHRRADTCPRVIVHLRDRRSQIDAIDRDPEQTFALQLPAQRDQDPAPACAAVPPLLTTARGSASRPTARHASPSHGERRLTTVDHGSRHVVCTRHHRCRPRSTTARHGRPLPTHGMPRGPAMPTPAGCPRVERTHGIAHQHTAPAALSGPRVSCTAPAGVSGRRGPRGAGSVCGLLTSREPSPRSSSWPVEALTR